MPSFDQIVAAIAGTRVLAGGQSLLNVLRRAAAVDALVDIRRLEEPRSIDIERGGEIVIGAGTRYDEVAASDIVRDALPTLATVAAHYVDRPVRARGTVGGESCFNDPRSSLPPLLVALDARFRIAGGGGLREVAAVDFFRAPFRTAVAQHEILHSVVVPALAPDATVTYRALQVAWEIARAVVHLDGEPIARARVVVDCFGPRPLRQPAIEAALLGRTRASVDPVALGALVGPDEPVAGDPHANAGYRLEMARVLVAQALYEAVGEELPWTIS